MSAGSFTSSLQHDQNFAVFPFQTDTKVAADDNVSTSAGTSAGRGHQQVAFNQTAVPKLKRPPEELEYMNGNISRLHSHLDHDQDSISHPDIDSPFVDELDAINRLLPYHIFQQPKEDMRTVISCKGKKRASCDWTDIEFTRSALECVKRREALHDRFRKLRMRSGQRLAPDDQAYYLAQVVLDADRSENAWVANELRNARTEAERLEREKRATNNAVRMSQFSATPQGVVPALQSHYYRGYPYSYTQAYGNPAPASTVSTFTVSPATQASTNYAPYQSTGAIPVQLPVASLPALHALGITPVSAASLPSEGQPQPPAVLRGSTANGTILSLEINVSLLQNTQMSGLAMVLNSLVNRGNTLGVGANNDSSSPQNSNNVDSSRP